MEPNFEMACQWWGDLPNIWTPIGWKDHLMRFNVFWDGMILAEPHLNRRTEKWKGKGVQLSFIPNFDPASSTRGPVFLRQDDGSILQGWNKSNAPVLWTEWHQDGVLLRQEVFAHLAGGEDVKTGDEPLFAWVRLSIRDLCPALPLESRHGFNVFLDAIHINATMNMRNNIIFRHDQQLYPRKLTADCKRYSRQRGLRVLEPNGGVRLGIAPRQACSQAFLDTPKRTKLRKDSLGANRLYVGLPTRKGIHVDLLVPIAPVERGVFDRELSFGYEAALRETSRYWKKITRCPTRFMVPEPFINETIRHSVRFSNILTEKNPATGKYGKINGSWAYADLWATPGAMDLSMMMDTLGHHAMAERYLDIFREEQGTVAPPGNAYESHPGYLSTPAAYKSIDWLSDHGAILYTICTHALLSGNPAFIERFQDCILKSCEWIQSARRKKGHGGYDGVLPSAVATDRRTQLQSVWNVGWNYLGLRKAVQVLQRIGHPRAGEFGEEAEAYKKAFQKAYRHKLRRMPVWRDTFGNPHRYAPTALAGDSKGESRHAFYLDAGPLFLVFAGLMNADDPSMRDSLLWFRKGPLAKHYRRDSNCWQAPALDHEMSSCEPCYSWNVFHSWQRGDREKFLEGMYSLFAGSLSRQTYISCETRGGITGNVFSASLAIYLARLAVMDDQIRDHELHLLRLVPLAWLPKGKESVFEKIPTEYGVVTLAARLSNDGATLEVRFTPEWRHPPRRAILHLPPLQGLKIVKVNRVQVVPKDGKVVLGKAGTGFPPARERGMTPGCGTK